LKTAQFSLASNPVLRAISGNRDNDEPDDTKTHRSVGVDPDFYDMVDGNIVSILLDACKPLFDLVNDDLVNDPASKPSTMKPADLLMSTAKLIIAAAYKMKEQARQEMAEEDLGGGIFDQDAKEMREAGASYSLPQVYDAEEQQTLDAQLVVHEEPLQYSLKKYNTRTKIYECDFADTGSGIYVFFKSNVRSSPEQVRCLR
jgi:hypothetical protein